MIFFQVASRSNSSPTKTPTKRSPPNSKECSLIIPNRKPYERLASRKSHHLVFCSRMCVGCLCVVISTAARGVDYGNKADHHFAVSSRAHAPRSPLVADLHIMQAHDSESATTG